jgi:hypothetical protein
MKAVPEKALNLVTGLYNYFWNVEHDTVPKKYDEDD